MGRVLLGESLIAEDAERDDRGGDRPVLGDDAVDHAGMGAQVVGVEGHHMHRRGARLLDDAALGREILGSPRGQHHGRTGREPPSDLDADLAAPAEDHDHLASAARLVRRVCHGSDYHLR